MHQALFQSPPLGPDYALQTGHEIIEQIDAHPHHSLFPGATVPEHLRRDGTLGLSSPSANGTRFLQHPPSASNGHYNTSAGNSDSGPVSVSATPHLSSSVIFPPFSAHFQPSNFSSAHQYPTGTSQLYSNTPGFSHSYGSISHMRPTMTSIPDLSSSGIQGSGRSAALSSPLSPSTPAITRNNYASTTPHLNRHNLSPLSHTDSLSRTAHSTPPESARSLVSGSTMPLSSPTLSPYSSASTTYRSSFGQSDARQCDGPPFPTQKILHTIHCEGQRIIPQIEAKVEKGFFPSGNPSGLTWTCYRRNYFSVQCHYTLTPHIPNARMYLDRGGKQDVEQIQALGIKLSAAVDQPNGKVIELIQHTPKRDKGPQTPVKVEKVFPSPPAKADAQSHVLAGFPSTSTLASPFLPLQQDGEKSYSPSGPTGAAHQYTFERIQFKSATANNGKRRAAQQYYHLIVELHADVRNPHDPLPRWVKIAERISEKMVVRGRSPSHYQGEGPHGNSSSRGGQGGTGSGASGSSQSFGGLSGSGMVARGVPHGLPLLGSGGYGGGVYRGSQYSFNPSPVGSNSVSSTSSTSGGPTEGFADETMEDAYQYFPSPLYETGLAGLNKSHVVAHDERRVKDENSHAQGVGGQWQVGACGRFEATRTSRGYYPDLNAGY